MPLSDSLLVCRVAASVNATLLADHPAKLQPGELLSRVLREVLKREAALGMEPGIERRPLFDGTQFPSPPGGDASFSVARNSSESPASNNRAMTASVTLSTIAGRTSLHASTPKSAGS